MPATLMLPDYRRLGVLLAAASRPQAPLAQAEFYARLPAAANAGDTKRTYRPEADTLVRRGQAGTAPVRVALDYDEEHIFADGGEQRWQRLGLPTKTAAREWIDHHLHGEMAPLYAFHVAVWFKDWLWHHPEVTNVTGERFRLPGEFHTVVKTAVVFRDQRGGWGLISTDTTWLATPRRLDPPVLRPRDLVGAAPATAWHIYVRTVHRHLGRAPMPTAMRFPVLLQREAQLPLRIADPVREQLAGLRRFERDILVETLRQTGPTLRVFRAAEGLGHRPRLAARQVLTHPTGYRVVLELTAAGGFDLIDFLPPRDTYMLISKDLA